jgi:predicted N-acetyltransferase YhbS
MQIERLNEYNLTSDIETQIADLLAQSFTTDFGGRSYFQQRHHVRFVARDGDAILGQMALCYRDIRIGGVLVPIWGLAEVATAPQARGKGVATHLLEAAIAFIRTTPAAFFVLFGNRPIYAGNGFEQHRNTLISISLEGAKTGGVSTAEGGGLMVLPLTDQRWDGAALIDLLGHKF